MKRVIINIDWSVTFWISIITIFLWLIAKAVGLINTPWFIEIIPYLAGILAVLSIFKELGKYVQKIDSLFLDVKDIKLELKDVRIDIKDLTQKVGSLDRRVAVLESRI